MCNDDEEISEDDIYEWEDLEASDGDVEEEDAFAEFETRNEEDELSETVFDPPEFWSYVHKLVDGRGKIKYDTLCNFVKFIMVLPHSSASAESKFSRLKIIKTVLRNRLGPKTIHSLMHGHRFVSA